MNIGEYIKYLRQNKNLSLNQLALYSNVSNAHISRIENGKRKPSPDILKKLSAHLDVSYEDLLEKAGYLDNKNNDEILTPDEELASILSDPDMHVAFQDYKSWTDEDKKELIAYLKAKRVMRENKEK